VSHGSSEEIRFLACDTPSWQRHLIPRHTKFQKSQNLAHRAQQHSWSLDGRGGGGWIVVFIDVFTLDIEWKLMFLSVTIILLDSSSGICHKYFGARSHCLSSYTFLLLLRDWTCSAEHLKQQANHPLVSFFNKLYVNQASRYYLMLSERNSGGKWGWNLQNSRWGQSHDSKANVRTDKSFISACLSNESFLSYQVGWPSLHPPISKYPPPFTSLCFFGASQPTPPFHLCQQFVYFYNPIKIHGDLNQF